MPGKILKYISFNTFATTQKSNEHKVYYDAMHEDYHKMQDDMLNMVAFVASNNADTMYYYQVMKV